MLSVYVICVGKLKEKFYKDACGEYMKRLSSCCKLTVAEIPEVKLSRDPTLGEIANALAKEGEAIRAKIPSGSRVAALCVEGRLCSSEELAQMLPALGNSPDKHMVFIIGGSYGLHPSVKAEADIQLSMSPMTFPHHLARVMLLEQVYRAFQINGGSRYHK